MESQPLNPECRINPENFHQLMIIVDPVPLTSLFITKQYFNADLTMLYNNG